MAAQGEHVQDADQQQGVPARGRRANGIYDRIIATAMDLFERQSVARTYVADIMRGEGLTRELFYYYYSSKQDLIDSVVNAYQERCREVVAAAVAEKGNAYVERHQAAVEAAMKLFYTETCDHTPMAVVLEELGLFRETAVMVARYGAECVLRPGADPEFLRKTGVLLLACIGLAEVSDAHREVALGQASRLITHVLSR